MTDPYTPLPEHRFTFGPWTAVWHGKLFHIDLNGQRIGQYDQDFRFGSEGIRDAYGHEHLDQPVTELLLGAR